MTMPDILLLSQLKLLICSNHRRTIQRRAYEVIGAIYRQLYEAVYNPANQYQNPSSIMPRTPEQVLELVL